MFIQVFIDEPKEIIIEQPEENHYKSDMLGDSTSRVIKIKGKAMVEARQETFDDRYAGRFTPNEKYDVVICFKTDYMGEEGKKRLAIKELEK